LYVKSLDVTVTISSALSGGKMLDYILLKTVKIYIVVKNKTGFRASAMTTMNKKPTRCTIVLKSLKLYCVLIPLYMFRALMCPSSGAS
jgi:hypothetical protein